MLKYYITIFNLFALSFYTTAQQTVKKHNRLSGSVTEVFNVLKTDNNIKQGLYQALITKKTAVASGLYVNNKKTGIWRFYDSKGVVTETYDYSSGKLLYEAPEDVTSKLRYFVDKQLDSTSATTKPIKIGGRYYGYIPYLSLFKLPRSLGAITGSLGAINGSYNATVELLVSPGGRLADYKVHLLLPDNERIVNMNINLPNPEDTVFFPATLNGEPVGCRIMISCYLNEQGLLEFD